MNTKRHPRHFCLLRPLLLFLLLALPTIHAQKTGPYFPVAPYWPLDYFSDGTSITITGCDPKVAGPLLIPASINNLPVTIIKGGVFAGCKNLTSIKIPNSVISIGQEAFKDCTSLTSVNLPMSLINIGESAFSGCSSLTSISIPISLTSIGNSAFSYCSSLTSISIPVSVTSIGNSAFANCTSLTSVPIPVSVTSIGSSAFANCTSLTSVEIHSSVKTIGAGAFSSCGKLMGFIVDANNAAFSTKNGILFNNAQTALLAFPAGKTGIYSIPSTVAFIGNSAFSGCSKLTSVAIPSSVTAIEDLAFANCSSLTSVSIPSGVASIGNSAFSGCSKLTSVSIYLIIGNSIKIIGNGIKIAGSPTPAGDLVIPAVIEGLPVTSIGNSAFEYCSKLTSVSIPSSVTSIGNSAFVYCSKLTSVSIPSSVTSIGRFVFMGCTSLTSVSIPSGVISIGNGAFANCTSLTSVSIPNSVTSIGNSAFANCTSLTSASVPSSVISIGNSAFANCASLTSASVPSSVISIGDYTFEDCISLTSVSIPNSVTSIGGGAFLGCSSLKSFTVDANNAAFSTKNGILFNKAQTALLAFPPGKTGFYSIPSTVISIEKFAFYKCASLTSLTIPSSVTPIGDYAFAKCTWLTSIFFMGTTPIVGNDVFLDTPATLYFIDGTPWWSSWFAGRPTATFTPATITFQPLPFTVTVGSPASFSVAANSSYPLSYQWSKDGLDIRHAHTPTFTIATTSLADAGSYQVTVSDNSGSVASQAAQLTVLVAATNLLYSSNGQTITINGSEPQASGNIIIPSFIDNLPVTAIGDSAFLNCDSLTSVSIPSTVTSIGKNAFLNCASLTSVSIPSSVTSIADGAFFDCTSLVSVLIPSSVTSIGNYAFQYCYSLTSVSLPRSLTSIADYAFYYCTSLISVSIPSSVTSIGNNAFAACTSLTAFSIPSSVTSIGESAFYYCTSLTSLSIPSSVTSIGNNAFQSCSSLTSVLFMGDAPTVGIYAFDSSPATPYYVEGRRWWSSSFGDRPTATFFPPIPPTITVQPLPLSVTLGSPASFSVTATSSDPFSYQWTKDGTIMPTAINSTLNFAATTLADTGLYQVTVSNNLGSVDSLSAHLAVNTPSRSPQEGLLFSTNNDNTITITGSEPQASGNLTIPAFINNFPVTSIGQKAFRDCILLTSISIPSSVTSIGNESFRYCSSLTSFSIPSSVTSIGDAAFYYCTSLTSISIPSSVTSIGQEAFRGCSSLESFTVETASITFSSKEGILFDKTQTALVAFPPRIAGIYSIPSSVTSIANFAFAECDSLTSVDIPSNVTSIGSSAFSGCTSLISAFFIGNAPSVGTDVFLFTPAILYYIQGKIGWTDSFADRPTGTFVPPAPPTITVQPLPLTVTIGSTVSFSVTATGTGPLSYQWSKDSTIIPDAINSTFTILTATLTDTGSYQVSVSNNLGSVASLPTQLIVSSSPHAGLLFSTNNDNTITITGSYPKASGNLSLPPSINNLPVTSIGQEAFSDCASLTSVSIPSSVTSIGAAAFFGCSSLASISIPSSVTSIGDAAFNYCTSLTSVTIPSSVTSIGDAAFYYCTSLTSVTIPSSVISIGEGAFYGCISLTSVSVPISVTSIANSAFAACTSLTSVSIPITVTSIGNEAFYYCSSLTAVIIPSNVTSIGNEAFRNCASLTSITIPSSVTSIGQSAFRDCTLMTSVSIPSSVISMGHEAFRGCSSLTSFMVDAASTTFSSKAGILFNKPLTALVACPPRIAGIYSIPSSVTSIGSFAFSGCDSLTSVDIPENVTFVGNEAFFGCTSLISAFFMGNAPSVGTNVFRFAPTTLYYIQGKTGWTDPFADRPTGTFVPPTPPTITVQPLPLTVTAGSPVTFSVTVTGTGPLSYQWSKDSTIIPDAVNSTLTIAATSFADTGLYQVTISNYAGSVDSLPARLTVNPTVDRPPLLMINYDVTRNRVELTVQDGVTKEHTIEYTDDFKNWIPLPSKAVGTTELTQLDPQALNRPHRFYRVIKQ